MENISIEASILFKKYPSIEIYYKAVFTAKGEEKAKEYLDVCIDRYGLKGSV